MAKKGKKRGAKGKYRPPMRPAGPLTPAAGPSTGTPVAAAGQRGVSQARVGGDQALVRTVEMSLGAGNQYTKVRGRRMIVESADPSIALASVPFFTRDLVRLGVVGAAMVVLLGVGSFLIPQFVK